MTKIFIVHHDADAKAAIALARRIDNAGFPVNAIAFDDYSPGPVTYRSTGASVPAANKTDDSPTALNRALKEQSSAIIPLLTAAARQNMGMTRFLMSARDTTLILPILCEQDYWQRLSKIKTWWDFRAGIPEQLPDSLLAELNRALQHTRVFISYSRRDSRFVYRLARDLDQLGIQIWLDVDDIPPGTNWKNEIQRGLDICGGMVLVVSPDAMESPHVREEWRTFHRKRKPLIPVRYRPAKLPFRLRFINYVDFHERDYGIALQQLCDGLRKHGINLPPP